MTIRKVVVIYNPVGGSANQERVNETVCLLKTHDVIVGLHPTTTDPDSATELTRLAVANGADTIIVFAGDGTVGKVATALVGTNVPMAIYPGGTGNVFVKTFYSRPTPEQFVQMSLNGKAQATDLLLATYDDLNGNCHKQICILGLALGQIPDALHLASPKIKQLFGRMAYVLRAVSVCSRPAPIQIELETPEDMVRQKIVLLLVLNVMPALFKKLSRGCNSFDNLMDVVSLDCQNVWQIIQFMYWLIRGKPERSKNYRHFRAEKLIISSEEPMIPDIDGDPAYSTKKIYLKVLPGAVSIILSSNMNS